MCGVQGSPQLQAKDRQQTGYTTNGYAYMSDGQKKTNASASAYGNSYTYIPMLLV